MPARATASRMQAAPSSCASTSFSAPPKRPIAVRTPETSTTESPLSATRSMVAGRSGRPAPPDADLERPHEVRDRDETQQPVAVEDEPPSDTALRQLSERVDERLVL